ISGAAWGKMSLEDAKEKALFQRSKGQEKTYHDLPAPLRGQKIRFDNVEQEEPIGELSAYYVAPGTAPSATRPISRLKVRSFITSLHDNAILKIGQASLVKGIAFDGGTGIRKVEISDDGGRRWRETRLNESLGKYSFREWSLPITPHERGPLELRVRATSNQGEVQPEQASWNPGGYARNVIESLKVVVA
ncbi:MAG: hypothetical protein ABJC66_02335, partial [Gammaproteobacteria bacterium]